MFNTQSVSLDLCGRKLTLETGRIARQADGAVFATWGETALLATAVFAKEAKADDEFAKSLGLEGLEQLRGLFKGQIEQELNNLTRTHMKRRLLDQLASSHDFDVPPSMVEAEFEQIWKQLEHEASHDADPEAALKEMEAEKEDYRAIAVRRVRLGLLLSEIGREHKIEISSAEMSRLIQQAAQQYDPKDRQRFVEWIQQDAMASAQLRAPLYEDKVVDFLFSKAEITDRVVTRAELEAAIEADEDEGHVHGPGCGHDHHDHAPKAKKAAGHDVILVRTETSPEDIEGMAKVRLAEIGRYWAGAEPRTEIHRAADLFKAFGERWSDQLKSGSLTHATFKVTFEGSKRERTVTIRPANIARYERDSDTDVIDAWLKVRGFCKRPADEDHADDPLLEVA